MWRGALIVLAACGGPPAPPPAPPPTCAAVADHVRALLPPDDPTAGAVRDAFEAHCTTDRWAVDAMRCMRDEPSLTARYHCKDKLAAAQRASLDADVTRITQTVSSPADYRRAMIDLFVRVDAILAGQDCVVMADQLREVSASWHVRIHSAKAWEKAHEPEAHAIERDLQSQMATKYQHVMPTITRCEQDPSFKAAIDAFDK